MQEMITSSTLQVNVKEKFHINFVTLLNNKILTMLNEKQEDKSLWIKQVA
jgi:DNA-dependent RNA polymerase auxiliary subunit epsilon